MRVPHVVQRVRPTVRAARIVAQPLRLPKTSSLRSDLAIVLPILGEVAYESLYWLPFVRKRLKSFCGTVVYFGRDGSESWSHEIAPRAVTEIQVNIHDVVDREHVRMHTEALRAKSGVWKQIHQDQSTSLYGVLIDYASKLTGLGKISCLYPEAMFNLVNRSLGDQARAWQAARAFSYKTSSTSHEIPDGILPPRYVATRFYSKEGLDIFRAFEDGVISELLETWNPDRVPIIDLTPPESFQDHVGLKMSGHMATNLFELVPYFSDRNLAIQSEAIARSERFIGSHGGLGYVAVSLGKESCLLESEATKINRVHRYFLHRMARATNSNVHQVLVPKSPKLAPPGSG